MQKCRHLKTEAEFWFEIQPGRCSLGALAGEEYHFLARCVACPHYSLYLSELVMPIVNGNGLLISEGEATKVHGQWPTRKPCPGGFRVDTCPEVTSVRARDGGLGGGVGCGPQGPACESEMVRAGVEGRLMCPGCWFLKQRGLTSPSGFLLGLCSTCVCSPRPCPPSLRSIISFVLAAPVVYHSRTPGGWGVPVHLLTKYRGSSMFRTCSEPQLRGQA